MKPVFLVNFGSAEDVFNNFDVPEEERKGIRILLAYYGYESYSGTAFVLFRKGKKLYEVHGSHCSCNGLEDQWRPESTTVKFLAKSVNQNGMGREPSYDYDENGRPHNGTNLFADELKLVLKNLSRVKARAKKKGKGKK